MTGWSLKHAKFVYAAVILAIVAGVLAYTKMPRSEDPGYTIRTARVTTYFPGASPERVEMLVTDPIEEAIQEMAELDYIKSESYVGLSLIDVYIEEQYTDIQPIWDKLRRKVNRIRPSLPEGLIGPYVDDEFGDVYGTLIALTGEGYTFSELEDIAKLARDDLLRLKDVAKVVIHGVQEERVWVDYNPARLAEFGLSATELRQILHERNIILPGGYVSNDLERIAVEPSGNFETLDDLRYAVINIPGTQQTVYLKDLADIHAGYVEPQTQMLRYNGTPALIIAVAMREGGNIIKLGDEILAEIERIQSTYPAGVQLELASFQTEVVANIINNFSSNLLQSIAIVIIVMLFTLGLRMGLVVASLIPSVILMSFVIMNGWGISLDQISLAALVISLGLFVDNSIVVNETISVQLGNGVKPFDAAVSACSELWLPLLISSLTTAAAFLPIYLAKSSAGEYTMSIFQVVFISLMSSWLLAMTFTPLMASQFIKPEKQKKETFLHKIIPPYERALHFCLRRRYATLVAVALLFIAAMVSFEWIPSTFFPNNDRPMLTIKIELPSTSRIEKTDEVALAFEKFLSEQDTVLSYTTFVAASAPRFVLTYSPDTPVTEYAFIMVQATTDKASTELLEKLRDFGQETFLDIDLTLRRLEYGPIVKHPVEIRIQGQDYQELVLIAKEVKKELASIPGTVNISDDWGRQMKKMVIDVDQAAALRARVTSEDVANSLQTYLTGFETTKFRRQEDLIPIMLRSEEQDRESPTNLPGLSIFSKTSQENVVPLRQVANIDTVWQPPKVFRRDTIRTLTVHSDLLPGYVAESVLKQVTPWLDQESSQWPPGFLYAIGGEQEESNKASKSITDKIPIAVLVILLLIMFQFNSYRRTLIIMLTIPLGLIGVAVGLLVTGFPMGFITFLGVVALAGIVINNGIVLIDRVRIEQEGGLAPYDALVTAAKRRIIPILLTTATTIGGMLPLIFEGGPMFSPMATAIVFGLLFATTFTLLVVPALYALFFKIQSIRD